MATAPAAPKAASPGAVAPKAAVSSGVAKPKVERVVEVVRMSDGRSVEFVGKRKMVKESWFKDGKVQVRLDFKTGDTRLFTCPESLLMKAACHGLEQKLGDETAGEEKVTDMIECVDDLIERLEKGEWTTQRAAGDSFSGSSIVIRALCEVTGKAKEQVKAFLQGKLDAAKAKGESLSRKALYDSFRDPRTKVGAKIRELEDQERAGKGIDANAAVDELASLT
jgi:hypothetical protein